MRVNFTPDLKEQLKDQRAQKEALANRPCIIMVCNKNGRHPVPNVDPHTREVTGDAQQFRRESDGTTLTILRRSQWVDDPEVIEVSYMKY